MTPARLLETVGGELKKVLADYKLPTEEGTEKYISVYLQHIPDAEWEDETYYPLVVVNVANVTDREDRKSVVELNIAVGVHGEEPDTWRSLLSIMERMRQYFCTNKIIANKYHVQLPNQWTTAENQPYPYWYGYGIVNLVVGHPRKSLDELEEKAWQKLELHEIKQTVDL